MVTLLSDNRIKDHTKEVLPGGERRSGFTLYAIRKQHARESVFRSERMPVSIDRYVYRRERHETCQCKETCPCGILVAVGIVCSPLSIPVGASKCAPVQHFINILGGVFLGPGYAVGMAFVTSLLRNLMEPARCLHFRALCAGLCCAACFISTENIFRLLCGRAVRTISYRRAFKLSDRNTDHGKRERQYLGLSSRSSSQAAEAPS